MAATTVNVPERAKQATQRLTSQLGRCNELESESQRVTTMLRDTTRGIFTNTMVADARNRLVEAQLIADRLAGNNDEATALAYIAIVERWTSDAIDLLNRVQRVFDYEEDIFGRKLPTGGLWDK